MGVLFDDLASQFLAYYDSTQGAVRGEVVRHNLSSHVGKDPLRVLDVGCGEGRDAIWLCEQGHAVTAVDPSSAMLAAARSGAKQVARQHRIRLRLLQCDLRSAFDALDGQLFDLVICHGVIMYQDDDHEFVDLLSQLVRPGGRLSLLAKNSDALAYRAASDGAYDEARRLIAERSVSVGRHGVLTRSHSVAALTAILRNSGFMLTEWFGVKIFCDSLTHRLDQRALGQLIRLEIAASQADPYRASARLLHVIARREP